LKVGRELGSTLEIGPERKLVMTDEAMKSLVSKFSGMDVEHKMPPGFYESEWSVYCATRGNEENEW
jgi:hypothetical protein